MRAAVPLVALALALALAGCGEAVDFGGEREVPKEYFVYDDDSGISFAVPQALGEATRDEEKVRFGDAAAFVELIRRPGKAEGFEGYVRSYEALATTLGGGKVDITEQDVPGAQEARLLKIVSPPKKNANARELRSRILIVRRGADVLVLGAGTQAGSEKKVDADAVIASLRLRGGS